MIIKFKTNYLKLIVATASMALICISYGYLLTQVKAANLGFLILAGFFFIYSLLAYFITNTKYYIITLPIWSILNSYLFFQLLNNGTSPVYLHTDYRGMAIEFIIAFNIMIVLVMVIISLIMQRCFKSKKTKVK